MALFVCRLFFYSVDLSSRNLTVMNLSAVFAFFNRLRSLLILSALIAVNIFKVPAEISALRESLEALRTLERSLARMLPEVIAQVATLLEDASALVNAAFEVQFHSLRHRVAHFDRLVPEIWYSVERLMVKVANLASADARVGDTTHLFQVDERPFVWLTFYREVFYFFLLGVCRN